jgi:hypothetical protein
VKNASVAAHLELSSRSISGTLVLLEWLMIGN